MIDFTPKIGMNTFMIEFDNPSVYYNFYYEHEASVTREPEQVSPQVVLQWKRQCEAEIQKRGLHLHDMGHGWTAEPFGIDTTSGWGHADNSDITEETCRYMVEIKGVRKPFNDRAHRSHRWGHWFESSTNHQIPSVIRLRVFLFPGFWRNPPLPKGRDRMAKFIPREKMSKKARKELAAQQRATWAFSPITKKIESKKIYNRNRKSHAGRDDDGMGFCLA